MVGECVGGVPGRGARGGKEMAVAKTGKLKST